MPAARAALLSDVRISTYGRLVRGFIRIGPVAGHRSSSRLSRAVVMAAGYHIASRLPAVAVDGLGDGGGVNSFIVVIFVSPTFHPFNNKRLGCFFWLSRSLLDKMNITP
jgi:hypothetical protein